MKNLPLGKPEVEMDDDKYVPGLDSRIGHKRSGSDPVPFNHEFKVKNTSGSQYHDVKPGSGSRFNDSEKESHIGTLDQRIKGGQELRQWTGTKLKSDDHRGTSGNIAYNSDPIPEVFNNATGGKEPPANAIIYNQIKKDRD